ncbi:site-specific integrase [Mesorhizobium sp. dw_380]|uniref:site-specific integrase n=1 Tax=Mesorhizobium sp. dw_380 TaxID=2812001 RepID=UPI001BDF6B90|nr:site-specific integrase [Mesorhizobium sp. dw_380]
MGRRAVLAAAEEAIDLAFPDRDYVVISRAGYKVDTSGDIWRIPHPSRSVTLNWSQIDLERGPIREATEEYFRLLIREYSSKEVANNWDLLKRVWPLEALRAGEQIPFQILTELENALPKHEKYRLHFIRKWYIWCCDLGYSSFSPEVAFHLEERVVGGNEKGHAVRSADPEKGPLLDSEILALINALRASRTTGAINLQEQVAVWLALAFGSNPEPMALLREGDFWALTDSSQDTPIHLLNIPRHKKGDPVPRTQFRERRLNPETGEIVRALIDQNRRNSPVRDGDNDGRPLFRRPAPRRDLPEYGAGSDYRYHHASSEFSAMVARTVERLSVVSPRTGLPLKVTMRRFRYTLATRLVREGASPKVVAQLLDHTDLQNVGVYFDITSDIVEHLDAAMALDLGPLSQAFLGTLVRTEKEAVRGDRPSSRIYRFDPKRDQLDALGTCGSFSFCGLTAPIACYTCVRFQPWMDAPHDKALSALLAERERRQEAGLDPSMIMLFDMTILAIADVIRRIEAARIGGANAG